MNRFFYVLAALAVAGCSNKNTYTVTGTVTGATDGDTVFIQKKTGRDWIKTDTAYITKGTFTFTGKQDTAVSRYVSYAKGDVRLYTDFFLENGNIHIRLDEESHISGTTDNDIYQKFKDQLNAMQNEIEKIYEDLQDTTLTAEQREGKLAELENRDTQTTQAILQTAQANITNPVGCYLLEEFNFLMEIEEIEPLLQSLPVYLQNNERIIHLKELVEKSHATAIGQKFVDFTMNTPEGNAVKLSDFIGLNDYTLVDFWASWCGPCRREMPNLVEAYETYKNKGFGIVGVSFDRSQSEWQQAIKVLDMTWPQMSDLKFWNSIGADLFAVRSIPYTVLIAKDGTIIAKGLHGKQLQQQLAELFH